MTTKYEILYRSSGRPILLWWSTQLTKEATKDAIEDAEKAGITDIVVVEIQRTTLDESDWRSWWN